MDEGVEGGPPQDDGPGLIFHCGGGGGRGESAKPPEARRILHFT